MAIRAIVTGATLSHIVNISHLRRELRQKEKPLRFLVSRVLLRSGLCRFFVVRTHGYAIRFYASELSSDIWYNPQCRNEDIQFLKSYLKPGETFVDVGANIGNWTLAAASLVGASGKVSAVEPHPRIFRFLCGNVSLNKLQNVTLHNCAVGDRIANISFSDVKGDDTNRVLTSGDGICVPMVTLDKIVDQSSDIALLKIDAEGYERFVLCGAGRVIAQIQCIFVEISRPDLDRYGCSNSDVFTLLQQLGFSVYRVIANSVIEKVSQEAIREMSLENIIGLRSISDFVKRTGWSVAS